MARLAIVRLRGLFGVNPRIEKTLESLRLVKNNFCIIVPDDASHLGMIQSCKDYVAWGEVDEGTVAALFIARAEPKKLDEKAASDAAKQLFAGKSFTELGIEPLFRLSPPKKGHKKGTKREAPFGALGKRGDMNRLLFSMM